MNVCAEQIAVDGGLGKETRTAAADDFESAIARIESAVVDACEQAVDWPARITAGIGAALDFMIANPAAARALTIDSRSAGTGGTGQDGDYAEVIGRFAALLGAGAPRADRLPGLERQIGGQRDRGDRQLSRPGGHRRSARQGRSEPRLPGPAALPRLRRGESLVGRPLIRRDAQVTACSGVTVTESR